MSSSLNMYVRAEVGVTDAELVRDASAAVGMEFGPETEYRTLPGVDEYFAPTSPGPFMLAIEDEAETFDFPIGDYRYDFLLDISGVAPIGSTPASAEVLALMRTLYDGLVATGRYTCTVIFDDLTLVATNDPNVQEAAHRPPEAPDYGEQ